MGKDIKELLKGEKIKKGMVFASLGLLFAASMYLIFARPERTARRKCREAVSTPPFRRLRKMIWRKTN